MPDQSIKNELSRLDRNSLYVLAKKLNLSGYRRLKTRDLIVDLILKKSTPEQIRAIELIHAPRSQSMFGRLSSLDWWKQALIYIAAVATIVGTVIGILSYLRPATPIVLSSPSVNENKNTSDRDTVMNDSRLVEKPSPKPEAAPSPIRSIASVPTKPSGSTTSQSSVLLNRARQLYNQRKYWDALEACDRVLSAEPNNAEALSLKKQINHTINTLNN